MEVQQQGRNLRGTPARIFQPERNQGRGSRPDDPAMLRQLRAFCFCLLQIMRQRMEVWEVMPPPALDVSDDILTLDAPERDLIDPDNEYLTREDDEPEAGSESDEEDAPVSTLRPVPADWDVTYVFWGAAAYMVAELVPNLPRRYSLEELM